MAMSQENIRALDQLRQRLSLLSSSIANLKRDLESPEQLITSWPSLQASAQALSFNLQQLSETFQSHRQLLKEAHAYPLPSFPGLSQEGLLVNSLLRKKLEPGTENWIETNTTKFGEQVNGNAGEARGSLDYEKVKELWNWAGPASNAIVMPMYEDGVFEDDFTIAEREAGTDKVVTGLRRKLDGQVADDDAEDDDGDQKMEDMMPAAANTASEVHGAIDTSLSSMPIDDVLKFATIGVLPVNGALANR